MRLERRLGAFALSLALAAAPGLAEGPRPVTVSPGELREIALIDDACPTFNWAAVPGAGAYELAVFAAPLAGEAEAGEAGPVRLRPVLRHRIPGAALGWTPAADRCLQRGGTYGWVVRAVGAEGPGEWSEPRAFRVSTLTTPEEVRNALQVLRSYLGQGDTGPEGARALSGLDARHDAVSLLAPADTGSGPPPPPPPPPPPIPSFWVDHTGGVFSPEVTAEIFIGFGGGLTGVDAERLDGRLASYYANNTHYHFLPSWVGSGAAFLTAPFVVQACTGSANSPSTCATDPPCSVNQVLTGGGCSATAAGDCNGKAMVTRSELSADFRTWICSADCTGTGNAIVSGQAICVGKEATTGGPED